VKYNEVGKALKRIFLENPTVDNTCAQRLNRRIHKDDILLFLQLARKNNDIEKNYK
jgi:hypothetical protein